MDQSTIARHRRPAPEGGVDGDGPPPEGIELVRLDVRPVLARGEEPFGTIMGAVTSLGEGQALALRTPFDPAPLHRVMAGRGFRRHTVASAPDDIETIYWRAAATAAEAPAAPPRDAAEPPVRAEIDVRGLAPPEPMERTLAALEELPPGGALVQVNDRVPAFLLPLLDERGWAYRITSDARGTVTTIWRDGAAR